MGMKRGILIDVAKLTVSEVEFDGLKDMYRLIGCDMVEVVSVAKNADLWVDEEGLLKDDGKGSFRFGNGSWLKGNGLLTGATGQHGQTLPSKMTLAEAMDKVIFNVQ
jgi:hypothetical protein